MKLLILHQKKQEIWTYKKQKAPTLIDWSLINILANFVNKTLPFLLTQEFLFRSFVL